MKKIISIVTAGLAALAAFVSCVKEPFAVFDASKATAPVVLSYTVTDDDVTVEYTPGTFGQSFNQNMPVNHYLLLTKVNGKDVEEVLSSSARDGKLVVTVANLSKALIGLGYEEGQTVSLEMVLRATMQEVARDNRRNGYTEADGVIFIADYEIYLPTGDPYGRYTEKSEWGLVGSFNGWGEQPDVEMWTNGTLHVAKGVTLAAGDEVKFRKNSSWDENFGYADGRSGRRNGEDHRLRGRTGRSVRRVHGGEPLERHRFLQQLGWRRGNGHQRHPPRVQENRPRCG